MFVLCAHPFNDYKPNLEYHNASKPQFKAAMSALFNRRFGEMALCGFIVLKNKAIHIMTFSASSWSVTVRCGVFKMLLEI